MNRAPSRRAKGTMASSSAIVPVVAANLRRLRRRRGLSLERLADAAGVSRAGLAQIEAARSSPTITVLARIARALGVRPSALAASRVGGRVHVLAASSAKRLTSPDGTVVSRALFPFLAPRSVELYELRLAARAVERAEAHAPGTDETLVVAAGVVEIEAAYRREALVTGDAICFEADVPHAYRNLSDDEAVMYLVMTYAEEVG